MFFFKIIIHVVLATLSTLAWISAARADAPKPGSPVLLDTIQVRGHATSSLISPGPTIVREEFNQRPGSVSFVTPNDYNSRAVLGLSDALARTPGVYTQNTSGQEYTKLSIRGSGLASPLGLRGLRLLRDGLPLSRADGIADPSYADPFNADYIEVYRGANALEYGGATLGGAINFVSPTGYSSPGLATRFDAGSNGYLRGQVRAGEVFENGMDAYAAISGFRTDGSSSHAYQSSSRFYGNLGFRFSPASEGRLHVTIESLAQELVNPLTLAQLQQNAGPDDPPALWPDKKIVTRPRVRLAYQHTLQLNSNDKVAVGVHYTQTRFNLKGAYASLYYDAADYGISLRGEMNRRLNGHKNRYVWGANAIVGRSANSTFGPYRYLGRIIDPATYQFEKIREGRSTTELFTENSYYFKPEFALVTGAQAVLAQRAMKISALRNPTFFPVPVFKDVDNSANYFGFNPKLGVLWEPAPGIQAYANINRSFEPPTGTEFYNATNTLKAQKAWTFEIGTRGTDKAVNWEAAIYHSRVKNELLNIEAPANSGRYQGGNIDTTQHTGLELGLNGNWALHSLPGSIDWGFVYTWSRFRFTDDAVFGNNALPGIPPHFGRLDLTYRHPSGVYLGPNLEFASAWYADQANTLEAPGYGIVNFTLGYVRPDRKYRLFLDARNLANKRYASTTEYVVNARGQDTQAFNPGLQRSIFLGAQIQW